MNLLTGAPRHTYPNHQGQQEFPPVIRGSETAGGDIGGMSHDSGPILLKDRRQRGLAGEIVASLRRRGSDRRYDRWTAGGILLAVGIPASFIAIIWALLRLAFAN